MYEAADKSGRKHKDTFEAAGIAGVKEYLMEQGFVPLSIREARRSRAIFFSGISQRDLLDFTQELGDLLESGMPIDKAVYVLSTHSGKAAMRDVLGDVYKDLQRGQPLSGALARHSVFPPVYVNMIKAGEAGGILESVIARLGVFLEGSVSFREEIRSAIMYPAALTVIILGAVGFLMAYVVPQFMEMFASTGQAPPLSMQILLSISGIVASWWWAMLLALAGALVGAERYSRTPSGAIVFDNLKLKLPMTGSLHVRAYTSRFPRTMGTLLQSGVPILEAIRISREVIGNGVVAGKLDSLLEGVSKGRGVSTPLRESGVFPPIVVQMVTVGEEAGTLDNAFIKVADRFEADSRHRIKRIMTVLPIALVLVMALVVGFIALSLFTTIYSINDIPF